MRKVSFGDFASRAYALLRESHCRGALSEWNWSFEFVGNWYRSVVSFTENRPSTETSNSTSSQPLYSPLPSIYKPSSSSDTSHLWNPHDSFNASSSFHSNDDSVRSLNGSESDSFTETKPATNYRTMNYNSVHPISAIDEQPAIKRELTSTLSSTPSPEQEKENRWLSSASHASAIGRIFLCDCEDDGLTVLENRLASVVSIYLF